MQILRITRSTADATETTYEFSPLATWVAIFAGLAAIGNFIINLATHYAWLKTLLGMSS